MQSRQPVRVWYPTSFSSNAGANLAADTAELEVAGVTLNFVLPPCATVGQVGTRLSYGAVQSLASVIVVVDGTRTAAIHIGQLADYVAMVGFAQIHLDADTGTAPTILSLFRETEHAPQGLSPWDQSFLHSLYTTDQNSVMQESAIKRGMFERIQFEQIGR